MPKKVSVVIPAYNAEKVLPRAVESLISTEYPDLEIIIVDDGSNDRTVEVSYAQQLKYPNKIQVLRHPNGVNEGVSASRNLGINNSNGELIGFLDADDYVLSHRFEISVKILEELSDVDAVYECCQVKVESIRDIEMKFWNENDTFGIVEPLSGKNLLVKLLEGEAWSTSAILVRRTLLDKTGLFQEGIHFAEDFNLWLRMASIGRVVPGLLDHPVSVYCRHDHNTFQYSLLRRVDLLSGMVSAYKWCKKMHIDKEIINLFSTALKNYLLRSIIAARSENNNKAVYRLTRIALASGCCALINYSLIRQYVSFYKENIYKIINI